jgi:hypothetical protein
VAFWPLVKMELKNTSRTTGNSTLNTRTRGVRMSVLNP